MKRRSGKSMVDLNKNISVVHFNVSSGYVTYLESEDREESQPRLKSILLEGEKQIIA